MRKTVYCMAVLGITLGAIVTLGVSQEATAGVGVGISINLGPPPIVAPAPPDLVLVPGSNVYFVPGGQFDVFFFNGYWWCPRGDRWFRARAYNGPWRFIDRRFVPGPVFHVPHDYRHIYARERHIPYGEWRRHYNGGRHEGWGEHHGRGGGFH